MDLGLKPLVGLLGLMVAPLSAQDSVEFNTPGDLEATMPLGCVGLDSVTSEHTPADMFAGVHECVRREDYAAGVNLLVVARAYGRFDMERVSDVSAHEAIGMLAFQLGNAMTEAQQEAWAIAADDGDAARRAEICNALQRMGPPGYYPHYMIQHGLDAMQPWNTDSALVADFDPETAWTTVLEGYECIPPSVPSADQPAPPPPAAPQPAPSSGKPSAGEWARSKPAMEDSRQVPMNCAMEGVWTQESDGQVQMFAWESTWVPAADGWTVSGPIHDAYGATELSGICTRDQCELEQIYEQGDLAGQSYQWVLEYEIQRTGTVAIEVRGSWGQNGEALGGFYATGVCDV